MKKQKLIIPLDDTPFSRQIISHVCRLYGTEAVTLLLLRVAPEPEGMLSAPPRTITEAWPRPLYNSARDAELSNHPIYPLQEESSERSRLEQGLQPVFQDLQERGFDVRVSIEFGDPVETIIEMAEREGADLVAMATHGRSGLSHLLQGSVAEQVLRRLHIPVLLVHPPEAAVPYN
jgi:nucleotide-binding universal stress UspA family protein